MTIISPLQYNKTTNVNFELCSGYCTVQTLVLTMVSPVLAAWQIMFALVCALVKAPSTSQCTSPALRAGMKWNSPSLLRALQLTSATQRKFN